MNRINMIGLPDLPMAANDNFKAQTWLASEKRLEVDRQPVVERLT